MANFVVPSCKKMVDDRGFIHYNRPINVDLCRSLLFNDQGPILEILFLFVGSNNDIGIWKYTKADRGLFDLDCKAILSK